ncbi:MAG: SH3 domain-containing protein [Spirochaetales bacterium]|nr:SH3 domain-containing protein [Spirochaetales bacterium]
MILPGFYAQIRGMFLYGSFFPRAALWVWLAVCVCFLAACGPSTIGYGVLLWPPDESPLEAGSVLPVYEESRLKQTYSTGGEGESGTSEIEIWRLRFFLREKEARDFAGRFDSVRDLFATVNRNALPIRERPDRLSRQVYRLRQDETIKILALSTTPSDENGLQGYWYHVLTKDGVEGYCFNYYLTLYNARTNTVISSTQDASQDAIAAILRSSWRPRFFQEMLDTGRIDLNRFRETYGLFFEEEPQRLRIVLPGVSVNIPYSRVRRVSGDTYIAEGSDVQMRLHAGMKELSISYSRNTARRTDTFVAVRENVEDVIRKENERRRGVLRAFLENGSTLQSDAYGEIIISGAGEFTWTGFERLTPAVISADAGTSGVVEFSVFASGEAQSAYAGIITFQFAGTKQGVNFFYRFTQQGTQFIHIPPQSIEENIVHRRPMNPLVLFFTTS